MSIQVYEQYMSIFYLSIDLLTIFDVWQNFPKYSPTNILFVRKYYQIVTAQEYAAKLEYKVIFLSELP